MWVLTSRRAQQLVELLAATPLYRWDLDALLDEQGWEVTLDTATPTGYLGVDTGWGSEHGHGLLLYLEDSQLANGPRGTRPVRAARDPLGTSASPGHDRPPLRPTAARRTAWSSTPEPAGC